MARLARIVVPGIPHHAVHRARPRTALFRDEVDYRCYQELLRLNCSRYEVELRSFCLMPDHIHAVLVPQAARGLSRAIGETDRLYARQRGLGEAQLWRGRFQSCPLDEEHAQAAIVYVVQNPDRARLDAWPWVYPQRAHSSASVRAIDTIRRSTKTGRPAGSPEFYVRLEYDIGRSLTPRRRGRKAKW
jgi:putative transposase